VSETWYVVPAAFALRNGDERVQSEEPMSWRLPEAWRARGSGGQGTEQSFGASARVGSLLGGRVSGVNSRLEPARVPMARRSNT